MCIELHSLQFAKCGDCPYTFCLVNQSSTSYKCKKCLTLHSSHGGIRSHIESVHRDDKIFSSLDSKKLPFLSFSYANQLTHNILIELLKP